MVDSKLWDPDEIIVQIEPGAKVLFLLAIILPIGLAATEFVASTPYETYIRGETQKLRNLYRVGFGASGLEVCGSSVDELYVVDVQTESLSNMSVMNYILNEDNECHRNDSEFLNVTELKFKSYWRFRVKVTPSEDGNVFFTFTQIDIIRKNNIDEWHRSYVFFLLCIMTVVVELKTINVIRDIKSN